MSEKFFSQQTCVTDFRLPDGSTVQAWIYTMNHLPEQAEVIPSGDWKVR